MRSPLVLAALVLCLGGIGGTGHAASLAAGADIAANDRIGCRDFEAAITKARRTLVYAEMSKSWDADRRAAFARLVDAQDAYARAVGAHETDRLAADAETAQRIERDAFLETLRAVVAGRTAADDGDFAALDAGLNAAYAHVMEARDTGSLAWGGVDRAGVRRTERAWLAYRDAFVAFAATLGAPHAVAAVRSELTRRRTAGLESLLAD